MGRCTWETQVGRAGGRVRQGQYLVSGSLGKFLPNLPGRRLECFLTTSKKLSEVDKWSPPFILTCEYIWGLNGVHTRHRASSEYFTAPVSRQPEGVALVVHRRVPAWGAGRNSCTWCQVASPHGDQGPHCQLDYTLRWHWRLLASLGHRSQTCHFLVALTPCCLRGRSDPAPVHGGSAWIWSGSGTFSGIVLWQPQELSGCRVGRMPQWGGQSQP